MELVKFNIKNYKSIKDSGVININPDLTILAGMNESGKTSILEALRDFSPENEIEEDSYRLDEFGDPEVSCWFRLDESKSILDYLGVNLKTKNENTNNFLKFIKENDFQITKKYDDKYIIGESLSNYISQIFSEQYKRFYSKFSKYFFSLKDEELFSEFDFSLANKDSNSDEFFNFLSELNTFIKQLEPSSNNEKSKLDELDYQIEAAWAEFPELLGYNYQKDLIDDLALTMKAEIPKFVFFSSFEDTLEFQFPIAELETKKINVDLCNLAGIDIKKLKEYKDFQKRSNYLSTKSANISVNFKNDWIQDKINIIFKTEDSKIQFGVTEDGDTNLYRVDQRSKGFQWFLSFYIKLNAQNSMNKNKIILVDEPGLYLHAKAQEDVLKLLDKLARENRASKVIISTHSPYLIDSKRLDRVLLVEKDRKKGTKIVKSHSGAKHETLTPILTKMGFDISKSAIIKEKNILVEGISDYYYLSSLIKILNHSEDFKNVGIIPSVGASQVPNIASLCIGWGIDYIAMFDNDKEGLRIKKIMDDNLGDSSKTYIICTKKDCAIEDLFTRGDFNKYVLSNFGVKNENDTVSNTEFMKNSKELNKVLLSKSFYDNVQNKKVEIKNSLPSFKKLLTEITSAIGIKLE